MLREIFAVSITLVACAQAAIVLVPAEQPTIQAGIDAAGEGDTVLVAAGTYSGRGNEEIGFHGIDRVLVSKAGAEATVIDVTGGVRGFELGPWETQASVIKGFTVTNARANGGSGGGIKCKGASPRIMNCILANNYAYVKGGGIMCQSCSPILSNCLISDNRGGGLFCLAASPILINCIVSDNRGTPEGGGLSCGSSSSPTLTNCVISRNSSWDEGGGLSCYSYSSPTLTNCTISGNWARRGGGVRCSSMSTPVLTNCILWGNTRDQVSSYGGDPFLTYCDVEGGYEGEGNIDSPPLFRSIRSFSYLLGPNSPCIDAGDPTIEDRISDWHPRWPNWYPNGSRSDMGAYGGPGNWKWLR